MVLIFNPNIDKHKIISMKVEFHLNFYFLPENSRISKKFVVRTKSCHYFHTFLLRYIFVVSILLSNSSACFSFISMQYTLAHNRYYLCILFSPCFNLLFRKSLVLLKNGNHDIFLFLYFKSKRVVMTFHTSIYNFITVLKFHQKLC